MSVTVTNLSDKTYTDIQSQQASIIYDLSGTGVTNPGIVLELASLDVSNVVAVDPSFAEVLAQFQGLPDCDAILEFDISRSQFDGLFSIQIDSSDVDDLCSNDVKFVTNSAEDDTYNDISDSLSVGKFFTDLSFSESEVKSGKVNAYYADQRVKKDFVRHLAKEITGGYSSSDIFTNETQLVNAVSDLDVSLASQFNAIIATNSGTFRDADSNDSMAQAAKALYNLNLQSTDGSGGDASISRSDQLLLDISAASANVASGNSARHLNVPLRFHNGDRIAVRLEYKPNGQFAGNGVTPSSRVYKVLFRLIA
jgi:hypothetical protein